MRFVKILLMLVMAMFTVQSSYAIYANKLDATQLALPSNSVIPPLVSILDATDTNNLTESIPYRVFKIGPLDWTFEHDCAASLVGVDQKTDTSYLFTSAHCVTDPGHDGAAATIDGPMNKRIVVGASWCDLASNTQQCKTKLLGQDPHVYAVKQIFVDKVWFSQSASSFISHDFAILAVKGVLKFNGQPITPMKIGYRLKDWHQEQALFVATRKTTKMAMQYQRPNYAAVTSLPSAQCERMLNSLNVWLFPKGGKQLAVDQAAQICTGAIGQVPLPFKSSSFCYGDSGGPLFYANNAAPSSWSAATQFTLVGNVSGSLALCSPALCSSSAPVPGLAAILPSTLTDNCYDNGSNAVRVSVPSVYGFPGSVLCSSGALSQARWLVAPDTWRSTSVAGLRASSLNVLTQNGFQPDCE